MKKISTLLLIVMLFQNQIFGKNYSTKIYDVRNYGAKGDGKTLDTHSIQLSIDECSSDGGGTVILSSGKFLIGTIYLKSNVTLSISAGAVLLGSTKITDYTTDTHKNMYRNEPQMDRCLIFAKDASSICIEGPGEIDGQGNRNNFPKSGLRPMLIRFLNCKDIHMKNISLKNPAAWTSAWLYCSDILVDGVRIHSRVNANGDGLDFDGCQNVQVSNCTFDTSDDSICLQTSRTDRPCRDVVISNCIFSSRWAGIRIGLLSRGDFESVTVNNCIFKNIEDSGLKIQMNEGGRMKDMIFSNLIMRNVPRPIFMTFCQQRACVDAPKELFPMKEMRNFIFKNFIISSDSCDKNSAIVISGLPNHPIEEIILSDIYMTTGGGGTKEDAEKRILREYTHEELGRGWPEFGLIGTVPSYGIYARHIKSLTINNIRIDAAKKDARPAIVLDDVADVEFNVIQAKVDPSTESVFRFQNVRDANIRDCSFKENYNCFLRIEGKDSKNINIFNSYFEQTMFSLGKEVKNDAIKIYK